MAFDRAEMEKFIQEQRTRRENFLANAKQRLELDFPGVEFEDIRFSKDDEIIATKDGATSKVFVKGHYYTASKVNDMWTFEIETPLGYSLKSDRKVYGDDMYIHKTDYYTYVITSLYGNFCYVAKFYTKTGERVSHVRSRRTLKWTSKGAYTMIGGCRLYVAPPKEVQ